MSMDDPVMRAMAEMASEKERVTAEAVAQPAPAAAPSASSAPSVPEQPASAAPVSSVPAEKVFINALLSIVRYGY